MRSKARSITQSAIIAALYVVLTHLQNIIFPNSASMAVQFRASEALCVLALFTPSAIAGVTVGCFLFNLTSAGTLALDFLIGSLASFCTCFSMWHLRKVTVKGYPLPALLMPALYNALLVGWELTYYVGNHFAVNAFLVGLGELAVMLTLGSALYCAVRAHTRHIRL